MKLLTAVCSASFSIPLCGAMFVQKEPQAGEQAARSALLESALLEPSSELQQTIEGFTGDPAGDLLGSVATMITDTMMPGILSAHNATQHQLDAFGQSFSSCPSPTTTEAATTTTTTISPFMAVTGVMPVSGGRYFIRSKSWQNKATGASKMALNWMTSELNGYDFANARVTQAPPEEFGPYLQWLVTEVQSADGTTKMWKMCVDNGKFGSLCMATTNMQSGGKYSDEVGLSQAGSGCAAGQPGDRGHWYIIFGDANSGWKANMRTRDCKTNPYNSQETFPYRWLVADGFSNRPAKLHTGDTNGNLNGPWGDGQGDWFFLDVPTTTTTTTTTALGGPQWITAKMEALKLCRQKEAEAATKNQACQKDLSTHEGVKNSTCNSLKALEQTPLDQVLCEPIIPYDQWLLTAKGKALGLRDSLVEKTYGCGNATQMYDDKVPECAKKQLSLDNEKTKCDLLQVQAEAGVCAGPLASQQEVCEAYGICYDKALSAYQEQEPKIKAMHLNWTVQWRTLKRMDCLLGVMQSGGTNDDVDKCKDKIWTTDHLDLVYPTIPEKEECPGTAGGAGGIALPCESDFLTKHYGNNPLHAPAANCTPCESETTTPSPGVSCTCTTPGQGASGHNGYSCDDMTSAWCQSNQMCVIADAWPLTALISASESDHPCAITCKCNTPAAGTSGHNQFECTDGTTAYCQSHQACVDPGPWRKADNTACQ